MQTLSSWALIYRPPNTLRVSEGDMFSKQAASTQQARSMKSASTQQERSKHEVSTQQAGRKDTSSTHQAQIKNTSLSKTVQPALSFLIPVGIVNKAITQL